MGARASAKWIRYDEVINLLDWISDASLICCFKFLAPTEFIHIRLSCKKFHLLTKAENGLIQQYWKQQCGFICYDTLNAIEHNDFKSENWLKLYIEMSSLILETKKDYIRNTLSYSHRSKLWRLYYWNEIQEHILPHKFIKFDSSNWNEKQADNGKPGYVGKKLNLNSRHIIMCVLYRYHGLHN